MLSAMLLRAPAVPELPDDQCTTGKGYLRYEDVCQDGRIQLQGLPHSIGLVVWRQLLTQHPTTRIRDQDGIIPVITRMVVSGTRGTVRVGQVLDARGAFDLGHTRDADGAVDRLLMNMWVELDGPRGEVGSVYVEHVFTRPFAPRGQRKVLRFDAPDLPDVPERRYELGPPQSTIELPDGAEWIDDGYVLDPAPAVFGLNHTDSNQHVNSLVYPRMFEEASLRHFAELGRDTVLLARYSEMAYRKPCFAGQRVRIALRAFQAGDEIGAVGGLITEEAASGPVDDLAATRPYCFARLVFEK